MGFGMGFLSTSAIVIVQGSVGWAERGAATASNIFSRNLGSALGAAVLGSVLNLGLAHAGSRGRRPRPGPAIARPAPAARAAGDAAVRAVLHQALHLTFWAVLLLTVLTLLLATLVPPVAVGRGPRELARRTERGVRWARAVQAAVAQLTRPAHAASRHGVPSLHAGSSISLPAPRPCPRR